MPAPSSDKPDLSTHPLVAKLLGDSDASPNLVALTGYFGPSKKADSVRLYQGLDFQSYVEIPKAGIVATTPVDAKDDTSPTIVHVKAGTHVETVQTSTQPVESFLQGSIVASDLNPQPLPPGAMAIHPTPTATIGPWCAWHSLAGACPGPRHALPNYGIATPLGTERPFCSPRPRVSPANGIATPLGTERPFCSPQRI